jgi:putative aldouronate transport system permease protein
MDSTSPVKGRPKAVKKHGFIKEFKTNKVLFLMLLIPLIYIIIQFYLPMMGLVVAFKNYNYTDGLFKSPWSGLVNFKYLFMSQDAWIITRNTIGYNLVFIFVGLFFAITFAVMLNELKNKFAAKFYQSVMFLPYFLSWVIVAYMVYALLQPTNGLISRQLAALHIVAPNWYQEPKYWPFILTAVNLWKNVGYSTVIYLAAITGIDDTYYEAATLDGCNKINQIKYITLPFLKPTIIVLTLMGLGNIFRSDFGLFYQVTMDSGMLYQATNTIDTYVYRGLTMGTGNIGMASAAGFYQSCVGFIIVLFANWVIGKISNEDKIF